MDIAQILEEILAESPICEYAFGEPSQIMFSDKVHEICKTDCPRFGHSWACPPNAGSIEDNIERVNKYKHMLLFSTIWEVTNSWDRDECLSMKKYHEEVTREIREKLYERLGVPMESLAENDHPIAYVLSAGCTICDECACPDEPCRHPKERLMTMESHGILIFNLCEVLGIATAFDMTTTVYCTMILFD